jgi:hypothetical protein
MEHLEEIAEFIKEKAERRGWENAWGMAEDKYGQWDTLECLRIYYPWMLDDIDSNRSNLKQE